MIDEDNLAALAGLVILTQLPSLIAGMLLSFVPVTWKML